MLRVLLLADSHIGFDLPLAPRVERPRRGPELLAGLRAALAPARAGEVALVVHGGDLFHRSRPPAEVVRLALEPLLEVADAGVPVVLVPGNHERSSLPLPLLALHPRFHVLDRPRTIGLELAGMRVAVGGFPCLREGVRDRFASQLEATGVLASAADIRLAAVHQTFEGATVGPVGYTFRAGADVVPGRAIPAGLAAVLSGHIHRRQRLDRDLRGRPLAAPVLYPGSIGRTSFAERCEPKGFVVASFAPGTGGGRLVAAELHELATRPMEVVELDASGLGGDELAARLRSSFASLPADAVVQLRIVGAMAPDAAPVLRAASLRALAPPTMIVEARVPGGHPDLAPSRKNS